MVEMEDIDLRKWRIQEVNVNEKTGKAPGVHEVGPELLRADIGDRKKTD